MPKKGRKDFTERLLAISELQPIAFEQLNLDFVSLHNSRDIIPPKFLRHSVWPVYNLSSKGFVLRTVSLKTPSI